MPNDNVFLLLKGELCFHLQVQFGEIEVVLFALIVEHTKEASIQWNEIYLGASSSDIKDAVVEFFTGFSALQTVGGQPDPWRSKVSAPVLICVSIALVRRYGIFLSIINNGSSIGTLHAFCVPVHGKGLSITQGFAGSISDIESNLLIYRKIPRETSCIAHPFRMVFGFFGCNRNTALEHSFRCDAISCLYLIWSISMHLNVFPCEETVQLAMVFSPGSCLDHEIGRTFARVFVRSKLSQNWLCFRQGWITDKEFYKERFILTCFSILSSKRMPPPVVPAMFQGAMEHACVSFDIMMIKHFY